MRAGTAAEVPERSVRAKQVWGPKVQQCLDDPEHRFFLEPGEDFEPDGYEGLRKRIHGIARQHKCKAHTQTMPDGSVAIWFYRKEQ